MVGLNGTTKWANVFHLKYSTSPPLATDLVTLGSSISSSWSTQFGTLMLNTVSVTSVTCTDLASPTGNQGISTISRTGAAVPSAPLPANCAVVVSWGVGLRYRGGHPRTYLPARNQADTSNMQFWTGTYQGNVQSAGLNFLNALNGLTVGANTFTMVMVSYFAGHAARPIPQTFPLTAPAVHPRIDSQRRRLGKEVR